MGLSIEYIAGLYDGDGSFIIYIVKHPSIPIGFQIRAEIVLSLSLFDSSIFEEIKSTFKDITFSINVEYDKGCAQLRIRSYDDCLKFIQYIKPYIRLPSNKYKLRFFEQMLSLIINHEVYTKEGFRTFLELLIEYRRLAKRHVGVEAYDLATLLEQVDFLSSNEKRLIKIKLSKTDKKQLVDKLSSIQVEDFSWDYLAGLFDADGSFTISLKEDKRTRLGFQVMPIFNLNLALYDINFLYKLKDKLHFLKPQIKVRQSNFTAYFQISGDINVAQLLDLIGDKIRLASNRKKVELLRKILEIKRSTLTYNNEIKKEILDLVNEFRILSKRR